MTEQFIHIYGESGGVTLAIDYDGDGVISVGAAYCSPSEKTFSRKKGRMIAEGRLEARRHGYVAHELSSGIDFRDLHETPSEILKILERLEARPYQRADMGGPIWWDEFCQDYRIGTVIPKQRSATA